MTIAAFRPRRPRRALAVHFGRFSAPCEGKPRGLIDAYRWNEGWAIWVGPIGVMTYSTR